MTEIYNVLVSKMLSGKLVYTRWRHVYGNPADKVIRFTTTTIRPSAKVLRALAFFKPLSLAVVDER